MKGQKIRYFRDPFWDIEGTVEYEVETDTWHGELITIKDQPVSALVTYEAKNAQELREAFKKAIWEYRRITEETKKMIENKYIEYTTKKGNLMLISYGVECFEGSGASAQYGFVYRDIDMPNSSVDDILGDEEVAKVFWIAKDEGDEALEEYINAQKPKKYKVSLNRVYRCVYVKEYEVEAENREEAYSKVDDLRLQSFETNSVDDLFDIVDITIEGDSIELI